MSTAEGDGPRWYEEAVLPVLLGDARTTYGRAIAEALAGAGCTDMPRLGSRLVGGLARYGPSPGDLADALGISKQATSQLIDTLVVRGYVERRPHPEDRRRMVVDLTPRGRTMAEVIGAAVASVDAELVARVGVEAVAGLRVALGALVALRGSASD
jgi:DNA-binding MarR family transcriptional regulator